MEKDFKKEILFVSDFCEALVVLIKKEKQEAYNIGSNFEYKNIDVVKIIAKENKKSF